MLVKHASYVQSKMSRRQIKKHEKISIVILTFNSENYINRCLESLKYEKEFIKEVVVVDNNSTDGTLDKIRNTQIVTKLIVNNRNWGFSKGINKGIKHTLGKIVLILNPDTIVAKGAIQQLLECQNQTNADVVGGKVLKPNGRKHNSFVRSPGLLTGIFDFSNLRKIIQSDHFHKVHYYLNIKYPNKPKFVDAVSGAFMLVKKEVFDKIGLFDERFFMYLEDIDFCLRAKQNGFKIVFCPMSTIIHEGGASSQNEDRINHDAWSNSRKYYYRKHFSNIDNIIIQPIFKIDDILTNIWRKVKLRW